MKILVNIFCLTLLINILNIYGQSSNISIPDITIISADAYYDGEVRENVTKPRKRPGEDFYTATRAFKHVQLYKLNLYLKVSEIDSNLVQPLYVKLSKNYKLVDDLINLPTDEILNFNIDVTVSNGGWYTLALGDFSKGKNIIYDKRKIYLHK